MDGQLLLTLVIVLLCLAGWLKMLFGRKSTGCGNCPKSCGTPGESAKTLVQLQTPPRG